VSGLHADLFTVEQRVAIRTATVKARREAWEAADRAWRLANHPEMEPIARNQLEIAQDHLDAMESLVVACDTYQWLTGMAS
jgi:hypothetical protein